MNTYVRSAYVEEQCITPESILTEDDLRQAFRDPSSVAHDPVWLNDLLLRGSNKQTLQFETRWLNGRLIHADLMILKMQFDQYDGFAYQLLVAAFRVRTNGKTFLQILHTAG